MRIVLLLLIMLPGLAQAAPFTVKTIFYKAAPENTSPAPIADIAVPYFESANAKTAAAINDQLFIAQFGRLAPPKYQANFSDADQDTVTGTAGQSFEVSRNDNRILTIDFDTEGCGAYCENYQTHYSFHVPTGRLLTSGDLLTQTGMEQLAKRMQKEKMLRYQGQITLLKKDLALERKKNAAKPRQEYIDDLEARIELNEGCLAELSPGDSPDQQYSQYNASLIDQFHYLDFHLTATGIEVTAGRCSNHAMRALDDVDDIAMPLTYADAKPYLSAYGRAILLGEGTAAPPSLVYDQLLRGKLGAGIAISMQLKKSADGSVTGNYFYDKYRKAIRLSGRQTGNTLMVKEQFDDESPSAELTLIISGGNLKGKWKGKKQFDIELTAP